MQLVILAAGLLAASSLSFAQAPQAGKPAPKARSDCSQAKDPKACEERRARIGEMRAKAAKACEGKHAAERRECMRRELCAQAKDPGACEARAEKAKAERRKAREEANKKP